MTQTFENAAVVDLSPPEDRGAALALNGAMLGLGLISGSGMSIGLGKLMAHAAPYLVASLVSLLMLISLVWFKETLSKENRVSFSWSDANPITSLVWLMSKE